MTAHAFALAAGMGPGLHIEVGRVHVGHESTYSRGWGGALLPESSGCWPICGIGRAVVKSGWPCMTDSRIAGVISTEWAAWCSGMIVVRNDLACAPCSASARSRYGPPDIFPIVRNKFPAACDVTFFNPRSPFLRILVDERREDFIVEACHSFAADFEVSASYHFLAICLPALKSFSAISLPT